MLPLYLAGSVFGLAQFAGPDAPLQLPPAEVLSTRVANQEPVGTFAMPVSALRYEPLLDLQTRNLGEAQADVSIRGGIFENTGFRIGGVSLYDPQTGHYLAEIPVPPEMLGAPAILTGTDNAALGFNANAGTVSYGWRPIENRGEVTASFGQHDFNRQGFYQGFVRPLSSGAKLGADFAWDRSASDGPIAFGDHHFDRAAGRLQLLSPVGQTDLFAGYQAKFFGWPNLYTPFNSDETENLKTLLVALNHRADFGAGDYVQAGAYYRRNVDDYRFNRFAPVGPILPFFHTTWTRGAAIDGRQSFGEWAVAYGAQVMGDQLESTSLTFGSFHTRTYQKLTLVPETTLPTGHGPVIIRAGATYDDTNRDRSAVSPILGIDWHPVGTTWTNLYLQYAETTQVPTYTALNSNPAAGLFRGNPNLGRESSRNLELGAKGQVAGWELQAAVFHRQDDSLVDWTFRQGVIARSAKPVDIGTTGFETVATRSMKWLDLVLGYTYLTKDPDYRGAVVDASFYALNFARHRVTAALTARLGNGFTLRLDNVYRLQEANPLRRSGREAVISSIGLYYVPPTERRLELSLLVSNLWNSTFEEVPGTPASPREVSAGLGWRR
ncbi:MAG TPA: TonB-dependent receptor [Lacunisphaera sp.]|nr:TonB-dependent receptor [Lacunisphaera sp.]